MSIFFSQLDIVKLKFEMPFFHFVNLPCIKSVLGDVVFLGHLVPVSDFCVVLLSEVILSYQKATRELD